MFMDSRFLHYVYRSVRRTVTYTPFYVFRTSRCKRTFLVLKTQKGVEQLVEPTDIALRLSVGSTNCYVYSLLRF